MTPLLVLGLWLAAVPATAPSSPATAALFAVTIRIGPAWVADKAPAEQSFFREHSENIRKLKADGHLVLGGRFSDVGLLLLRARDTEEARALIERDPAVKAGVFAYEAHPWHGFAWGCVENPGAPAPTAPR
jgi:uncharacterized protein YciI